MSVCDKCCFRVITKQNELFCSIENCLCKEVFYCEDYEPIVKPITNADLIRSMTDEELADYLRWHNDMYSRNGMDWLDWLKQEVEESGNE